LNAAANCWKGCSLLPKIRCARRRCCDRHQDKFLRRYELSLEGVVGKRIGSAYEPGERSGAWIKHRTNREQDFVIGGYIPGSHGFDALLVGVYENKRLIFVAKVKNGFVREDFAARLQAPLAR
jgi:ATP-dependent DNA ligase